VIRTTGHAGGTARHDKAAVSGDGDRGRIERVERFFLNPDFLSRGPGFLFSKYEALKAPVA
jgi:hypothetical protein